MAIIFFCGITISLKKYLRTWKSTLQILFLTPSSGREIRPRLHSNRGRPPLSDPRQLRRRRSSGSFWEEVHGNPEVETSARKNRRRRRVRRPGEPNRPPQLRLSHHRGRLNGHSVARNETGNGLWFGNIFVILKAEQVVQNLKSFKY